MTAELTATSAPQVHKIAQLDIRMANTDRNGGNILACHGADGQWELVPVRPQPV